MLDPFSMPVIRVEFRLADGTLLTRDWTMAEAASDPVVAKLKDGAPAWLRNPRKAWDHPQDPITFKGDVKPGFEQEARYIAEGEDG